MGDAATPNLGPNDASHRASRYLWDMPCHPYVPRCLLEEIEQGHPSPTVIERLLAADPALAAKTLRIVNSDYYGLSGQVDSIGQAVLILGMQQIRNLVMSVQALTDSLPHSSLPLLSSLWSHSYGTAVGAGLILRQQGGGQADIELAYLGGLLNGIGKLFLLGRFPCDYPSLPGEAAAVGKPLTTLERERFGVSHAEAGQHLMRHWRFPLTLRQVVASPAAGDLPGSLIQLAVQVASQVSPDPLHTTPGPSGVDQDALVRLAWGQAEVDWFVAEVGAQLTDAESELGGTQLGDAA